MAAEGDGAAGPMSDGRWTVGAATRPGARWAWAAAEIVRGKASAAAASRAARPEILDMEGVHPVRTMFYLKSGR